MMSERTRSALTRRGVLGGLAAGALCGHSGTALAQNWPDRPVTIVVPFPAGGNTDTMARLLAEHLKQKIGGTFIVDNRPNGGGVVAAGQVARAAPDGSMLIFASAGQNIILPMLQKVSYDPEKDLVPVSVFGTVA